MVHWKTTQLHPSMGILLLQNRKNTVLEIVAEKIACKAAFFFFNLNYGGLQTEQHNNWGHHILRKMQNSSNTEVLVLIF